MTEPGGWHRRALVQSRAAGLRPKKSFGQNFLRDPGTAARIAAATVDDGGTVVEVGAGLGALTEPLLLRATRVIAIERDRDLVPILRAAFDGVDHLKLEEADAARFDYRGALALHPRPWILAGNLPYQLTGKLLEISIGLAPVLDRAVFMVQREVADRVTASVGTKAYGALSVFAQNAFRCEVVMSLPPGAFFPSPKVASAIVVLTPHETPLAEEDEPFRRVVKTAFSQRRKKLRNTWGKLRWGDTPEALTHAAARAGVDLARRPEELPPAAFAAMADELRAVEGKMGLGSGLGRG
ncbi:MAG: 16S rRNA (adenine(1518)-N(6)/adenine(1519)-N(6))-dimethyltransferase RsmA [Myxococcota bacterium]